MLVDFLIFAVGLVVLYFGADWLIRGAASLALKFGIRPLVVGLTVIALGTSMPEFLVNYFAALTGEDGLAIGNIVGSNICNIALILGISSLVFPMAVRPTTLRKEYPIMFTVMIIFYLLSLDGTISQIDGLFLVLGLVAFLLFVVFDARKASKSGDSVDDVPVSSTLLPMWQKVIFLLGGMVLLTLGARMMVYGAQNIAGALGISPVVIGLTVVAIGTSLPELAASVMCAMRKEADMSVGNILGSNLLNVLFVVGMVSLIRPLSVEPQALAIHFPVMIAFTVLLFPLAWTDYRITRLEGSLLVVGFTGYMVYLFFPYL